MKTPKARKLPSGSWFVRVMIDGKSINITRPTEREAIAEAMALKAGVKDARSAAGSTTTLRKAIDEYIDLRQAVLSPSTIRGYRIIQNNRFPSIMDCKIGNISDADFQRAINIESKKYNAKTLRNSWAFIASVLREAESREVNVRLPQIVREERKFLQPDEIPAFIDAINGTKHEAALLLGLHGLRASEIMAISRKDIDLAKDEIIVHGAAVLDESNNLVQKKENKNASSRRSVPILIPRLRELMQQSTLQPDDMICTSANSGSLHHAVTRACTKAELPLVGVHGLRHSFASLCYHKGVPEAVTMKLGGWSDPGTMRKIYTHIADKDLREQAESLASFFQK